MGSCFRIRDYNEYITGKRSEGSIYGNFSLTRRLGQMLAQSLVVLMIGWIGYSQQAAQAGQAQSAQAVEGLVLMNLVWSIPFVLYYHGVSFHSFGTLF